MRRHSVGLLLVVSTTALAFTLLDLFLGSDPVGDGALMGAVLGCVSYGSGLLAVPLSRLAERTGKRVTAALKHRKRPGGPVTH